jgi:hypothetical protein
MDVMPNDLGPFPGPPGPTLNPPAGRRLPELIRSIGSDVSLLVRQQADLAKQEMKQKAGEKALGGGLLVGAVILALFVLGFLGLAGAAALQAPVGGRAERPPAQGGQGRAVGPVVPLADVDQGPVEVEEDGQSCRTSVGYRRRIHVLCSYDRPSACASGIPDRRSSVRRSSSRAATWPSTSAVVASTGSKSTPRIQTIPSGAGLRRRRNGGGASP